MTNAEFRHAAYFAVASVAAVRGRAIVTSPELAKAALTNPSVARRDMVALGVTGRRGVGFKASMVASAIGAKFSTGTFCEGLRELAHHSATMAAMIEHAEALRAPHP